MCVTFITVAMIYFHHCYILKKIADNCFIRYYNAAVITKSIFIVLFWLFLLGALLHFLQLYFYDSTVLILQIFFMLICVYILQGWLSVKDNTNSEWLCRWVVLCGPTLSVYQDQDESAPAEITVEMSAVTGYGETAFETTSKYVFQVCLLYIQSLTHWKILLISVQ